MPQLQNVTSTGRRSDAWKDETESSPAAATLQSERDATIAFSEDDDFFCILGISPNATVAEIRSAFERQSRHYHPDRYDEDSKVAASKNFRYVEAAYEVLNDDTQRSLYKTYGHQTFGKVSNDPLLRYLYAAEVIGFQLSMPRIWYMPIERFKDCQWAKRMLPLFVDMRVVVIFAAAVCIGTSLLRVLLMRFLALALGVSVISRFGFVVLNVLSMLSGVAFTSYFCQFVHTLIVLLIIQDVHSVFVGLHPAKLTNSTTSAMHVSVVVESDMRTESGRQYEATEDGSAAELNDQASVGERALHGSPTVHQGSLKSLRRRDPAAAESANTY